MITGNEPVMPSKIDNSTPGMPSYIFNSGLTIRQHFAAMAMQGMCAIAVKDKISSLVLASWSADFADALIAELNKEK